MRDFLQECCAMVQPGWATQLVGSVDCRRTVADEGDAVEVVSNGDFEGEPQCSKLRLLLVVLARSQRQSCTSRRAPSYTSRRPVLSMGREKQARAIAGRVFYSANAPAFVIRHRMGRSAV